MPKPEETYPDLSREPQILADPALLNEYCRMRENGEPHGFAAMLVTQTPPGCMTDDVFFSGIGRLGDEMGEKQAERITSITKGLGFSPSPNSIYMPGLADFQGDPKAYINKSDGRHAVKKRLEEKGMQWDGRGEVKCSPAEPPKDIPLAPDLVEEHVSRKIRNNPDLAHQDRGELRQEVIDKHGYK